MASGTQHFYITDVLFTANFYTANFNFNQKLLEINAAIKHGTHYVSTRADVLVAAANL